MGQRLLEISNWFLLDILSSGYKNYLVENGLPADIEIINSMIHFERQSFILKLQSAEWSVVPEGERIPHHYCTITRIQPKKSTLELIAENLPEIEKALDINLKKAEQFRDE